MRVHRIARGQSTRDVRAGWVVAREVPATVAGATGLSKGRVLTGEDLARLETLRWDELHLIEPEVGDLHELAAGQRIAAAAAGTGIEVGKLSGGHLSLRAQHRGIIRVAVDALTDMNDVNGVCVYTRWHGQIVEAGTVVARAKVSPLVIEESLVVRAERIAAETGGVIRVDGFRPATVGMVVQETIGADAVAKFLGILTEKLAWFGATLLPPVVVASDDRAIVEAVNDLTGRGASIILMGGTKSLDPLDPAFRALGALGVELDRYGVPAHPGSLLWLGHRSGRSGREVFLGLPTCGLFAEITTFDIVFPRVVAAEHLDARSLSELAHGGLLARDVSFFAPYGETLDSGL